MTRDEALQRLESRRGELIGMLIGSGLFYRYAEMNQIDLILTASTSRYRQMGLSSLTASLPFGSSNEIVMDFSIREVISQQPKIPVFFGLFAADPLIRMEEYLHTIKKLGFTGICNLPTISLMDGEFGAALSREGFSYQREVEAIRMAHKIGLLTIAMARNREQARQMAEAGCDILAAHFGASKGGLLGVKNELTLEDATRTALEVFDAGRAVRDDMLLLMYGGPSKTPSSVKYLISHTNADGFLAGYTIERHLIETSISSGTIRRSFYGSESAGRRMTREDYVDYAKAAVDRRYAENISLQLLADTLHISRSYLSTVFQKETGVPFSRYLMDFRIRKAQQLLREDDLSIVEVANAVGYGDYVQFSKMFKKWTGVSPSAFRKLNKST